MKKIYNISLSADPLYEITLFVCGQIDCGVDLSKYSIFLPNKRSRNTLKKNLQKHLTSDSANMLKNNINKMRANSSFIFPQLRVISDEFNFNKLKITMLITNLLKKNIAQIPVNTVYELAKSLSELLINLTIGEVESSAFRGLVPEKLIEYWSHTITILEECIYHQEILKELSFVKNKFSIFITSISKNNEKVISVGMSGANNYIKQFLKAVHSSDNGIIFMIGTEIEKSKNYYCNKKLLDELQIDGNNITETIISNKKAQENFPESEIEISEFCQTSEEALAVAMAVRKAVYEKKSVLIVTADKKLGQKIKSELLYWNIFVDDSSGIPFFNTKAGILISNIIDVLHSNFTTTETLNMLKINKNLIKQTQELELFLKKQKIVPPFFFDAISLYFSKVCGQNMDFYHEPEEDYNENQNVIAVHECLKHHYDNISQEGNSLTSGSKSINAVDSSMQIALEANSEELYELIKKLEKSSKKINTQQARRFSEWCDITKQIASIIDATDSIYFENIISNFKKYSDLICELTFDEYKLLLINQILKTPTRSPLGYTDGVVMLGMLEAQLMDADMIIIAGANEANMSPSEKDDFWFSKSMLDTLHISSAEVKNEFIQCIFERLINKSHTIITRSRFVGGVQQQRYSYLDKIATNSCIYKSNTWKDLFEFTKKQYKEQKNLFFPPIPPQQHRPNNFSVTDIDLLKNNPYAFYAKKILKLKELNDESEQKNIRGNYVHKTLEHFFRENKNDRTIETLNAISKKILKNMYLSPAELGIWFFRLNNIFSFILDNIDNKITSIPEIKGEYNIKLTGDYSFSVSCIADRIDILNDGSIAIVDYKTGILPKLKQIECGFKPQLPIEALIARYGNFNIGQRKVSSLCFWKLNGSKSGGEICHLTNSEEKTSELMQKTLDGLMHLIYKYNVMCIPYDVNPNYQYNEKYNHLARVKEWLDA